jgi:hypothetical protein
MKVFSQKVVLPFWSFQKGTSIGLWTFTCDKGHFHFGLGALTWHRFDSSGLVFQIMWLVASNKIITWHQVPSELPKWAIQFLLMQVANSSERVGSDEVHFNAYHFAIGDTSYQLLKSRTNKLSLADLHAAMKLRYPIPLSEVGHGYLSLEQKTLVSVWLRCVVVLVCLHQGMESQSRTLFQPLLVTLQTRGTRQSYTFHHTVFWLGISLQMLPQL